MALINAILNRVNCNASGEGGLGTAFCPIDAKMFVTLIRMPLGFKIAPDVDFNLEYVQEQQQRGIFDVIPNIINMTDNTPENAFSTQEGSGIQALTLKSPYLWNFSFNGGLYNFKSLVTRESGGGYAYMAIDQAGNLFGAEDKQGNFKGLKAHLFSVAPYKAGNDNTHMVMLQTDRADFDKNVAWITAENLDFSGEDLTGWNDINLTLTAPVAGSSITFTVFAKSANKPVALEGLEPSNFLATSAGNTNVITAVTPDALVSENGKYVATLTTALTTGQTATLRLFDSALNANIILLEDAGMYKSNVATTVVV